MKTIFSVLIFSLTLLFSCVKNDNNPGCEVKGTWIGEWSASNQSGTWICYANNSGTEFNGYVFVWFDLPSLENVGLGIEGELRDKQVLFKHYFSGATLTVRGGVDTDSLASGRFDVSNIGMSGTWQGKRIPTLNLTVVDSFPMNITDTYDLGFTCDNVRNHLYISKSGEVQEYNYKGGLIRTFNIEKSGNVCFDGNHLWFLSSSYGKIIETDTLGVKKSEFNAKDYYSDAIMFDGINLKEISCYSRKIYTVSKSGVSLGSQDFSYLMITGLFKYEDGYLAISRSFPGTIFLINSSGVPQKAFRFTSGYLRGIAIDGNEIWCVSERYIVSNTPGPSNSIVKLFKLRI